MPKYVYGYEVRDPVPSEHEFFKNNKHIGGYVADDKRIVINPHSSLKPHEKFSVAKLEAMRAFMNEHDIEPDFDVTPEQHEFFKKNDPDNYGKLGNERYLKQTIASRIFVGDPTAGNYTPQQKAFTNQIASKMQKSMMPHTSNPNLSDQFNFNYQEGGK
jgi:hypothetical protein